MPPAPGKRSADSHVVRDADWRAVGRSQRLDPDQGRTALQSKRPRQFARGRFFRSVDQLSARLVAAVADDLGKPRPRPQRIGKALRLDIGAAAALGAHQAAFGERRQRTSYCVAVDPIGLGDFGLARQAVRRRRSGRRRCRARFRPRPVATARRRRPCPACSWPKARRKRIAKIIRLSRNSHGASISSCLLS